MRAVQRRLGMLACTSDLSVDFKEELRGVRSALEQQRSCNSAVDGVVSQEVTEALDTRTSRYMHLSPIILPFWCTFSYRPHTSTNRSRTLTQSRKSCVRPYFERPLRVIPEAEP